MAISYVSTASAASNTVTMPAHQTGDMIFIQAFNKTNTTLPTIVSGYKSYTSTRTASCVRYAYKIATSASETTGTWTNATAITVTVYRKSSSESWMAPVVYTDSGTGTSMTYAEGTYYGSYFYPQERNTRSWMLRFATHATATDVGSSTPAGWTSRTSAGGAFSMDSNTTVAGSTAENFGGNTITVNASGDWTLATVQLRVWDGTGVALVFGVGGTSAASFTGIDIASGDLIVAFATRSDSNTPPTLPSGYTNFDSGGANTLSALLCYKVAAALESVPTFTNATSWTFMAYRAAAGSFTTISQYPKSGLDTTMDWTGSTLTHPTDTDDKYIRFGTFRGTGWPVFAPGWPVKAVRVATSPANFASDAEPVVAADSIGGNTITLSTSMAWRTYTVQIMSKRNTDVENTNASGVAVPTGIGGCYVTLIGGGGGGGGTNRPSSGGYGGGGGGGGATIRRAFIPANALGSTYSLTRGTAGSGGTTTPTAGTAGTASTFTSGSITLTAGGGSGGAAGGSGGTSAGGSGGTYSSSGWGGWEYVAAENGATGGTGSRTQNVAGTAGSAATYAAPGGGGGGSNISTASAGGAGGTASTSNVSGGAGGSTGGGTGGSPVDATLSLPGGGGGGGGANSGGFSTAGAGGKGSVSGAGGGGAGGKEGGSGNGNSGGAGGAGYAIIEWISPLDSGQFFRAFDGF